MSSEPNIFSGWKIVVLSFVVATIFWFFSALSKEHNSRIKHPIKFVYNRDSLIAVKPLPEYVDIDVSGGGWDLFKESLWLGNDPIMIELENPTTIQFLTHTDILSILTDQLDEYQINFLFTDTLFIDIDQKTSKKVSLIMNPSSISMEEGYRITTPVKIIPDTAVVYGPTSFLDSLSDIYSIPLDAKEIDENFDQFIVLGLPEYLDIYSDPLKFNIKFDVNKFAKLELPVKVEMLNFPDDSSVYVVNTEVVVYFVIQESLREDFFSPDFKVVVDYNMINKTNAKVPVIVVFYPENAIEVNVIPDSLAITYVQ